MKNTFNKFIYCLTMVLAFSLCLFGCKDDESKQAPIYQGMIVSGSYSVESANIMNNRYHGDCSNRNDNIDKDKPFGDNKPDVEDITSTLTTVPNDTKYYADLNEDVYITVKFSNPDEFEILSFVLDSKKYTSYMFEENSDLENITIKVNSGDNPGFRDYEISEIKYVDGTDIKDVPMNGDKVATIGVRTSNLPSVVITNQNISLNQIEFDVTLSDTYSLIEKSEGNAKVVLFDGVEIIEEKILAIGENNISFSGLVHNKLYQYAIISAFDDMSGDNVKMHILDKVAFYTPAINLFDVPEISETSISWNYSWHSSVEERVIVSQELYLGETLVKNLNVDVRSENELLSNNTYSIKTGYKTLNGETEYIYLHFSTLAKDTPIVEISNLSSTKNNISFEIDVTDNDNILTIEKITLNQGETVIEEKSYASSLKFEQLESNTLYNIIIFYSYDLNDGSGKILKQVNAEYTTLADEITVVSLSILNSTNPKVGEEIHVRVTFENPSNIEIQSFEINDNVVEVVGGDRVSSAIVKFVPNTMGGDYLVELTSIEYLVNGIKLKQNITSVFTDTILVLGDIDVTSIEVDNDYKYFSNTITIKLNNPTNYDINKVVINNVEYTEDSFVVSEDKQSIDLTLSTSSNGYYTYAITKIGYGVGTILSEKTLSNCKETLLKVNSEDIIEVKTAEELQNMQNYNVYSLANDIDLVDYDWTSYMFEGVLLGNDFKIKNLTYVVEDSLTTTKYVGLFSSFEGLIVDVTLSNIYVSIKTSGNVEVGGLIGEVGDYEHVELYNCSVSGDINVETNNMDWRVCCGGLIGLVYDGSVVYINNCYANININILVKNALSNNYSYSGIYAGGLIGIVYYDCDAYLYNNNVIGKIKVVSDLQADVNEYIGRVDSEDLTAEDNTNTIEIQIVPING